MELAPMRDMRRMDRALLATAALLGAILALAVASALAGHMHEYKGIHHGLGQEPGTAAHPFFSSLDEGAKQGCTAIGASGAHWYYSCTWNSHVHSNQCCGGFDYSVSSAHIELSYPVIDHHHHFPH